MVFPWLAAATIGSAALSYKTARDNRKARITGLQAGKEDLDYYNTISPNSTEFERLGVPAVAQSQIGADASKRNAETQAVQQALMATAQIASQKSIANQQVKTQKEVAEIQAGAQKYSADNQLESAKINAGKKFAPYDGEGRGLPSDQTFETQRAVNPKGKLSRTQTKLTQIQIKKTVAEIKGINATRRLTLQKLLTELEQTKSKGNEAEIKAKELDLFEELNNTSYIGKEVQGLIRLLPDWAYKILKKKYNITP